MWASAPTNMCKKRTGRTGSSAPTKIYNGTQRFCTIGAYVDGPLFPRQGVLLFPCVATVIDESVVPRRRRCNIALQRDFRVLAATCFYGTHSVAPRYNPIRIQRLFLPTFSGATEKVCPRSDGYSVAVKNGSSGANRTSGPMCTRKGWAASVALLRR